MIFRPHPTWRGWEKKRNVRLYVTFLLLCPYICTYASITLIILSSSNPCAIFSPATHQGNDCSVRRCLRSPISSRCVRFFVNAMYSECNWAAFVKRLLVTIQMCTREDKRRVRTHEYVDELTHAAERTSSMITHSSSISGSANTVARSLFTRQSIFEAIDIVSPPGRPFVVLHIINTNIIIPSFMFILILLIF